MKAGLLRLLFCVISISPLTIWAQTDPQGNVDYFHIVCGGQGYNGSGQNEICFQIRFYTDNSFPHQFKSGGPDLIITGNNLVAIDTTVAKAFSGSNFADWDTFTVLKADNPDPTAQPFHMHYGTANATANPRGPGNFPFAKICVIIDDTGTICIDTLSIAPMNNSITTESGFTFTPGWGGISGAGYPAGVGVCCTAGLCTAIPGDATANGAIALNDIISLINYIFCGGNSSEDASGPTGNLKCYAWPACPSNSSLCWLSGLRCRGDWNGNGRISLSDPIMGINYIFNRPGGPWTPVATDSCCQPGL